jgi:hypothetical protein
MERLPDGSPKVSRVEQHQVNINLVRTAYSKVSPKAKEFHDRIESLRNDKAFVSGPR